MHTAVAVLTIVSVVASAIAFSSDKGFGWKSFLANISAGSIGVSMTYFLIDQFVTRKAEINQRKRLVLGEKFQIMAAFNTRLGYCADR